MQLLNVFFIERNLVIIILSEVLSLKRKKRTVPDIQDILDNMPPGQRQVGQVDLQGDTACTLGLLPTVVDLCVAPHCPERVCRTVVQVIPQVSGRYLYCWV